MNARTLTWWLAVFLAWTGRAEPASKSLPATERTTDLFSDNAVPRLRIEISPPALEVLRQYEWNREDQDESRTNVFVIVREGAHVYTNVALHLKGAAGSFRSVDSKPALTLNFDKAAEGQRFHGLQKIHLNNSVQDPSYLSEIVCRELFQAAGVPVPRATHAVVELNGQPLGLYVLVEGWNKQFLKRHFQNPKGSLWDGGFARDITGVLRVNSGEEPVDRAPLDRLVKAAAETNLQQRLTRMAEVLDVDRFLTFMAMEVMLVHWDGYAMNRNNYRVYHDPDTRHLVFLPHGLDQMFGVWRTRPEHPITPQMRGLVAKAILQPPEGRRRYLDRMSQLFTNVYHLPALTNRVNELAGRVQGLIGTNRMEALRQSRTTAMLLDRIVRREDSLRQQLTAINTPLQFGGGQSAPLRDWNSKGDLGNPSFDRAKIPGDILQITASGGVAYGSWRSSVLLEAGHYRFEGRVKTTDLKAQGGVTRGGVTLRVSGERQATMYADVPQWRTIAYEFTTGGLEDVELICELRASSGWAWFEVDSLRLLRLDDRPSGPRRP